jgi:hypothetical protein
MRMAAAHTISVLRLAAVVSLSFTDRDQPGAGMGTTETRRGAEEVRALWIFEHAYF